MALMWLRMRLLLRRSQSQCPLIRVLMRLWSPCQCDQPRDSSIITLSKAMLVSNKSKRIRKRPSRRRRKMKRCLRLCLTLILILRSKKPLTRSIQVRETSRNHSKSIRSIKLSKRWQRRKRLSRHQRRKSPFSLRKKNRKRLLYRLRRLLRRQRKLLRHLRMTSLLSSTNQTLIWGLHRKLTCNHLLKMLLSIKRKHLVCLNLHQKLKSLLLNQHLRLHLLLLQTRKKFLIAQKRKFRRNLMRNFKSKVSSHRLILPRLWQIHLSLETLAHKKSPLASSEST